MFAATPLGTTLASDVPGSMRDLALTWMETHYAPFGDLLHTATTGEPAATHHYGMPFFTWMAEHPDHVDRFSRAMAGITTGIRIGALDSIELDGVDTLVDVGGANGEMLSILAERHPSLRGVVFDLPHVVPAAEKTIAGRGLAERLSAQGGDFFTAVPSGDGYLLSHVLHDWNDAECTTILTNVRRAGGEEAKLRLLEFVVPPGDPPHMSKMIDLTMLGMLPGRERDAGDFEAMLRGSGFALVRIVETPTPLCVIEATAV
jgi:hypothetical protein